MGAMPATQHMTAGEYLALPEPLHRRHTELMDGEIVVHEPLPLHQHENAAYEREGLPGRWLVDADAKVVLVFRRSAPGAGSFDVALEVDHTLTSPQLDGFELPLGERFPE
jgi:Uma2 family endonuclease